MMQGHLCLRGNAYAQIMPGLRGSMSELIPIHPDMVTVDQLENNRLLYTVKRKGGGKDEYRQDQIFHIRGLSTSGITGLSPITMARESLGLSKATEMHGAKLFSNGASPGGVIEHPGKLLPKAYNQLRESWQQAHGGVQNAHKVAILEEGMKWTQMGMSSEDAQFLETRKYQAIDIARIYRVPPHMIAELDRATFSNIEHQSIEFVMHTIRPWLVRWEQAIQRCLINEDDVFAEFNAEGLLRGDTKSRYEAYASAITNGWMTRNEVRKIENLDPLDGLDEPIQQLNMGSPVNEPNTSGDYALMVQDIAGRLARAETRELAKRTARAETDPTGFSEWVDKFYSRHSEYIKKTIRPLLMSATHLDCVPNIIVEPIASAIESSGITELKTKKPSVVLGEWNINRAEYISKIITEGIAQCTIIQKS